jgi:nitrogen regulatory protein PII
MKMIVAYIRPEAFEPIREELLAAGFPSLTIECVVESDQVSLVTETILRHARTGEVGDGKIFVLPVEQAIRVRTGESGQEVLQAHESEEVPV